MEFKEIYIVLIFSICLFVGCNSQTKSNKQAQVPENIKAQDDQELIADKAEDFKLFYSKFLRDEKFQLTRIEFPLAGEIVEDGVDIEQIEKKDWTPMKGSIYEVDKNEYQVEIKEDTTEVYHRIYVEDTGIDIEAKYKQIDGKWYLVYYRSIFI